MGHHVERLVFRGVSGTGHKRAQVRARAIDRQGRGLASREPGCRECGCGARCAESCGNTGHATAC
eukprot:1413411-Prymnesium_polylepis.2